MHQAYQVTSVSLQMQLTYGTVYIFPQCHSPEVLAWVYGAYLLEMDFTSSVRSSVLVVTILKAEVDLFTAS